MPWDVYACPYPSDLGFHWGQTHLKCGTQLQTVWCKTILVSACSTEVCRHTTEASPFIAAAASTFLTWWRRDIMAVMVPIWAGYCCQNICDFHHFFLEKNSASRSHYSVFKKYHFTFSICVSWFVSFRIKYHISHAMALAVSCLLSTGTTRIDSRSDHMGCDVDNVAHEWVFFWILSFPCQFSFQQLKIIMLLQFNQLNVWYWQSFCLLHISSLENAFELHLILYRLQRYWKQVFYQMK